MTINPEAEAELKKQIAEMATNAFLELRDTISPHYNAVGMGYNDPDHARLTIVKMTIKQMDKLASEHLRKNS